jgi:hypothetical protein
MKRLLIMEVDHCDECAYRVRAQNSLLHAYRCRHEECDNHRWQLWYQGNQDTWPGVGVFCGCPVPKVTPDENIS